MEYDFHQLSPRDFEHLSRDLLQESRNIILESFKTGRDGGIDFRYSSGSGKTIVQCKHYVRTGLNGLLRDLKHEASKIKKLAPSQYILTTSIALTPANKEQIVELFGTEILATKDILGQDDLNNLLSLHSAIENRHYKLWLASRAVLDRVINNAVITQSEFWAEKIHQEIRRYVQSTAFHRALETLGKDSVVIIAGPPGIGKTTLANVLMYEHLEKGYQAIVIRHDPQEGKQLFQRGKKQVFYFDDFMGTTFLGDHNSSLSRNGDRAILDLIAMVRATPKARFILTTRDHILNQALEQSERLRLSEIIDYRVVLLLDNYSFGQKAEILFNHIYFSDLPTNFRKELLADEFYLAILKHKKFSPRLIDWLSTYRRVRQLKTEEYRPFVRALLDDPSEIWRHAYENEISESARSILLSLFSLDSKAGYSNLEHAFMALHSVRASRYRYQRKPEDFRRGLRELLGAFLKIGENRKFEVLDPSVIDLLNAVVRGAPENAIDLVLGSNSIKQIDKIWGFAKVPANAPVLGAITRQITQLIPKIEELLHEPRRIDMKGNAVGFRGATFERRLAFLIEITDHLRHPDLLKLVEPLSVRLFEEWKTESSNILDAIEMLKALGNATWDQLASFAFLRESCRGVLLKEIEEGCDIDELKELISTLELDSRLQEDAFYKLQHAFQIFLKQHLRSEISSCITEDHFDALIADIEMFGDKLDVEVGSAVLVVDEAKEDFIAGEEAYADSMEEEWKERWREERESENEVREMFNSLKFDND